MVTDWTLALQNFGKRFATYLFIYFFQKINYNFCMDENVVRNVALHWLILYTSGTDTLFMNELLYFSKNWRRNIKNIQRALNNIKYSLSPPCINIKDKVMSKTVNILDSCSKAIKLLFGRKTLKFILHRNFGRNYGKININGNILYFDIFITNVIVVISSNFTFVCLKFNGGTDFTDICPSST